MQWQKTIIPISDLPLWSERLKLAIKNGENGIENMRCVYQLEGKDYITAQTVFDFCDSLAEAPKIKQFSLYQALGN